MLNDDFALLLRQWATDQFAKEPAKAVNIGRVIIKFSRLIQSFEQGNPASNLEIAIASFGYLSQTQKVETKRSI